ncbi:MAG: response regulator transcription factor [Deltaproteobacteria bacterium]|nr:response regulator transcription factor [Deltaproteobacteria bacterium]
MRARSGSIASRAEGAASRSSCRARWKRSERVKADDQGRKERILVIEDDNALRNGLALNFRAQGYEAICAADGDEGMRRAFDDQPDLIVLDIMLPGWSGLEILSELRDRGERTPVLILSARNKTREKIEGLGLGADDYVTKPFELPELLARVEAMLRRTRVDRESEEEVAFGQVVIAPARRSVSVGGEEIELSAKEYNLLSLLASSPGRPFTREEILHRVWGWDFDGTARTVDNVILSLRKKIETDPSNPRHIKTVRQVGYKLDR